MARGGWCGCYAGEGDDHLLMVAGAVVQTTETRQRMAKRAQQGQSEEERFHEPPSIVVRVAACYVPFQTREFVG